MLRSTMTTPAVAVDHGHRQTYVPDATYADVETQVSSWACRGQTEIRRMVHGLLAGRPGHRRGGERGCSARPCPSAGDPSVRWWNEGTPMSIASSSEPRWKEGSWWPKTIRPCHPGPGVPGRCRCLLRRDEVT